MYIKSKLTSYKKELGDLQCFAHNARTIVYFCERIRSNFSIQIVKLFLTNILYCIACFVHNLSHIEHISSYLSSFWSFCLFIVHFQSSNVIS